MQPTEAAEIIEEARITRKCWSADNLARWLGLKYLDRQALGITTIGSINVGKGARRELRLRSNRLANERRRRERGMRPQSESLSRKPWEVEGVSRRTWYRRRGTVLNTAVFLSTGAKVVPTTKATGPSSGQCPSNSPYDSLPVALRLHVLGLDDIAVPITMSVVPCWVFGRRPVSAPSERAA